MPLVKTLVVLGLFVACSPEKLQAQPPVSATNQHRMEAGQQLSAKQQVIVTISAFTAQGNIPQLQHALNTGLDAGLTLRIYACAGFPRSLNALQSLMGKGANISLRLVVFVVETAQRQ